MSMRQLAFAVPGNLDSKTGGYIYDRRLIAELRNQGREVQHIELGSSFPDPSAEHLADAKVKLSGVPKAQALIVDGLALGAMDSAIVRAISAPLVALIHHPLAYENGIDETRKQLLFETEKVNLSYAKEVIVPSANTKSLLVSEYEVPESKITIARPGVDRKNIAPKPQDPPLILSVGIQVPRKGHDVLLEALAKIVDLRWQAVLVGGVLDPKYGKSLVDLRERLGLASRVLFAGELGSEEVEELYSQATVFALATRHEGYGMVFDEAMSFGLPIVSCDVGAVSQTIASGAGILTEVDNPEAFADALRSVLLDHELRNQMVASSQLASQALGSWEQTAITVASVLDSL